jgi:hypothetical protein
MEHVPCGGYTLSVHFTEESAMSKQELYEQIVALFAQLPRGTQRNNKEGCSASSQGCRLDQEVDHAV